LWAQPVKRTKPSDLLASIYGWVTEGFDTPDMKGEGAPRRAELTGGVWHF
jgi:hypothetical protein